MTPKRFLFLAAFSVLLHLFFGTISYAQHNSSWGRPPDGWDDFYMGLVNDYKKTNDVGEPGYWLDVISKANGLSTYNTADPNKKSVLYHYKYINAGVDTSTNWNNQKGIVPYGLDLLPSMRYDADVVGMRCAWVIYMAQEETGAAGARDNIANATWLKKYFLNIKYVAQTGAGKKEIFILEPDLFGYIIKELYDGGYGATALTGSGIGLGMPAAMSTIAADPNYSYLAGLPNTFRGFVQGIIKTIRIYNPQAYCGLTVNLWGANTSQNMPPAPPRAGTVWYNTAQLDAAANYQADFYKSLLINPGFDKSDFLISEKNGLVAAGYLPANNWMWGDQQMQNYLYFFKKLGQSVCLPIVGWQISLGQTSNAAGYGITLTNPPVAPYTPLPNASQGYEDTFVQYMFNNFTEFIDAGFIGWLGGKGVTQGTDYSLKTTYGDKGFFFNKARTVVDPGRPWNLNRGITQPDLGEDTSLCGTDGSILLNPGNMGASPILWSTGDITPTINVNSAGTYWIKVGNGTDCARYDTIVVSNTFVVNLGADQNLCSSGSIALDAGHSGTNVSYVWKKDGVVQTLDVSRYMTVSAPGTYRVEVTDPSCLPMKADDIMISSSALTTNSGLCVNFPSAATLTVSNTGGTYRWYSAATGGASLFTGSSYTTGSLTEPTTFYVADEALYNSTIVAKTAANGFSNQVSNGNPNATTNSDWLSFDVLKPITLVSFTTDVIVYFSGGTLSADVFIDNPSTGFTYTATISYPTAMINSPTPVITSAIITLPTALVLPAASGYRIRLKAVQAFAYYKGSISTIVHPKTHSNLITTTGYACATSCAIAGMPAIYNWVVKAASTCARTPVQVRSCGTLPVDFISITAQKEQTQNKITWRIAATPEVGAFQVEHSLDARSFEPLFTSIYSSGNTYWSYDAHPYLGRSYYRIKQTDPDGTLTYSSIVVVSSEGLNTQVNVFPNPSHGSIAVLLHSSEESSEVLLKLFTTTGSLLLEKQINFQSTMEYIISEQLKEGIYILKIRDKESERIFKLIKE
ncbi:MAG: T9SS type A sorting domain-containing protein [Cytophagaceae bacterium]|nr:T9SS type A sorting domain-containing protein [Cytophagaceae bacterium]